MSLFYTGKGDKGKSDIGKKKVSKRRPEIAALCNLDELNSLLGLVKNQKLPRGFGKILMQVQEDLFIVQANVGGLLVGDKNRKPRHGGTPGKNKPPVFRGEKIKWAEKLIDGFEKEVRPARGFVVPGANAASAWLHFARTVARRTEVSMVFLRPRLNESIPPYMNRLSSLLYAMARAATVRAGLKEKNPEYK